MTLSAVVALFGIMVAGALIPGISVLAVSARSAAFGFAHGVFTTIGIVVGDILFIVIAIYGLSVLAGWMGEHFVLVKYIGGAYLVWLGVMLWRSRPRAKGTQGDADSSLLSSFLTGLIITLGDQKAILFYLGIFPAAFDLSVISLLDTGIIIIIAAVAVGGTKLIYAFLADRAGTIFKSNDAVKRINAVAGSIMVGVGVFLMARI